MQRDPGVLGHAAAGATRLRRSPGAASSSRRLGQDPQERVQQEPTYGRPGVSAFQGPAEEAADRARSASRNQRRPTGGVVLRAAAMDWPGR